MPLAIFDPCLYSHFEDYQLAEINGSYVDDFLRAGTNEWKWNSYATLERFETTGNQQPPFTFAEMHITKFDSMYHINQDFDMSKIEPLSYDAEFSKSASMRMKLAWLANTWPEFVL